MKVTDAQVNAFAKSLSDSLTAGYWGEIEPEIFKNIGYQVPPDKYLTNKYDEDMMANAVPDMTNMIRTALEAALSASEDSKKS